jgi:hypothetical protein
MRIHLAVLLALVAVYVVGFRDVWFPPPGRGFNLDGLGAAIVGAMLTIYAAITTVLAAIWRRRPGVIVTVHALAILAYGVALAVEGSDRREREHAEEQRRAAEARERPPDAQACLRVLNLHVRPGSPLTAEVVLLNDCEFALGVAAVSLWGGFPDGAGNDILGAAPGWSPTTLTPKGTTRVPLDARITRDDLPPLAGWRWKLDVRLDPPHDAACYEPAGARCGPLGPVTVDPP